MSTPSSTNMYRAPDTPTLYNRLEEKTPSQVVESLRSKPLLSVNSTGRELTKTSATTFSADPSADLDAIGSVRYANLVKQFCDVATIFLARCADRSYRPSLNDDHIRTLFTSLYDKLTDSLLDDEMENFDNLVSNFVIRIGRLCSRFTDECNISYCDISAPVLSSALEAEYVQNPGLGYDAVMTRGVWLIVRSLFEFTHRWWIARFQSGVDPVDLDFDVFLSLLLKVDLHMPECPYGADELDDVEYNPTNPEDASPLTGSSTTSPAAVDDSQESHRADRA